MTVIKCPTLLSAETLAQKVSFEELTVFLPSVAQYCTLLLLPVRVLIIMIANAQHYIAQKQCMYVCTRIEIIRSSLAALYCSRNRRAPSALGCRLYRALCALCNAIEGHASVKANKTKENFFDKLNKYCCCVDLCSLLKTLK